MSAKDIFHDVVKKSLEREDWTITDDPLYIKTLGIELFIDLAAEKLIGAEKEDKKIAVEIKSFVSTSAVSEFHKAVGQFMNYRLALQHQEPDRILLLAIPNDTYNNFFKLPFIQVAINEYKIGLIVYDPSEEVIVKWLT